MAIDLDYWTPIELRGIAEKGFPQLRLIVDSVIIDRLTHEASGSPQLMQAMCLDLCFEMKHESAPEQEVQLNLTNVDLEPVLRRTSARTDYRSLVRRMHQGPKSRGSERKEYKFADGTIGDVYGSVLSAVKQNPPTLSFSYQLLQSRVASICVGEPPRPQSIFQCCGQISQIAASMSLTERVVEWDEDESLLEIIDPYFLFYLRWSGILQTLGRHGTDQ